MDGHPWSQAAKRARFSEPTSIWRGGETHLSTTWKYYPQRKYHFRVISSPPHTLKNNLHFPRGFWTDFLDFRTCHVRVQGKVEPFIWNKNRKLNSCKLRCLCEMGRALSAHLENSLHCVVSTTPWEKANEENELSPFSQTHHMEFFKTVREFQLTNRQSCININNKTRPLTSTKSWKFIWEKGERKEKLRQSSICIEQLHSTKLLKSDDWLLSKWKQIFCFHL